MKRSISKPAAQALVLFLTVLFLAKTGEATTASMLSDQQLIASSRVILVGDVQSIKSQWDLSHENIFTYVKIKVSKTLKGQLQNDTIVFKQLGGTVGDDSTVIFGAPDYRAGQRVLLFLDTASDGTLRVAHLFQGKYDVADDARTGKARVKRDLDKGDINILGAIDGANITNDATLTRFTKKIKRVLRDNAAQAAEFAAQYEAIPIVETPPEYIDDAATGSGDFTAQYAFLGSFRWFEPDTGLPVTYRVNPTGSPTPNGGNGEVNQALAAWTNVQTTALTLQNGGSTTALGFRNDGVSAISYNDPLDQMSDPVGCSGVLAIGGVTRAGGGTRVIGGITFSHIFEGDVVFNRNFQCFLGISANLAEVATHEIGHSIGFGHSPDFNAIMYASAHGNGRGATLGSDDIAAVTFLYPGSKGGTPPPPPPPPPAPPAAPGALAASAASTSSINLSWADNSNNENGFRLERKTGASGTYALIATIPANQIGYADGGLAAATTYFYRIKAYNGAGESAYSNEAFATTSNSAPPPPPPPPTTLTITTTSLAPITRGVPYSQQLSASGGATPYTWSLTSGALPPGLSLSSAGLISGTPTTSGGFGFTVTVRDRNNATASRSYKFALR
ncbi:MAG TPA: putative Ig domain-containing protein [Blastocatellia bacterium]|nr:putative Ig domain-containing protein [Blastocatellia bacterium]